MLLDVFLSLSNTLQTIPGIKFTDWFNDQYSGTIHTAPAAFIEFPQPLSFVTMREGWQKADMTVRIHLVSKAIAKNDQRIDVNTLREHETITEQIFQSLHGVRAMYPDGNILFDSMHRVSFEHHQYLRGWLITVQDFKSRVFQQPILKPKTDIATLEIISEV